MAGLMDDLMVSLGMMAPMAQEKQKTDEFGVALPPEPGQQVGPQGQPSGLQQHMGEMGLGQQPMDPNMIQMLMQMIMGNQAQPPQGMGQGQPPQMPPQMPPGGRGF